MNLFKKLGLALFVLSFAACTDLDELLVNPNGVDPSEADAESLYNNIQLGFSGTNSNGNAIGIQPRSWGFTSGLSRMRAEIGGFTYTATHSPTEFDGLWQAFYSSFLPDAEAFIEIAEPLNLDGAVGSVKVMQAYGYMMMVDLFGDIPLTEAGQGNAETQILNPSRTDAAEVYAYAEGLLDEAIMMLDSAEDFSVAYDNFYGGNAADWAALARTLKLRASITTRLVGGASDISAIVESGDIIDANGENFEFQFGTSRNNPNNRHFFYNDAYENSDGTYMSNWYMWLLAESKGFPDPRVRYYFYRQEKDIYPDVVLDDPNAFDCIFTDVPDPDALPPHYEAISDDMPYCLGSYDLGYFGRDHLNGSGIPPDGAYRTVYGLYPGGGKFDNGVRDGDVQNGGVDGALGAGINPIWQASWTHFILAEAALTGNFEAGDARELLLDGIQLSFDRVQSFESLVNGGEILATTPTTVTVANTFPADSLFDEYIAYVGDEFDDADAPGKLAIVAREYMIALWGNGIEAYNLYRRTCLPGDLQPGIDPNAGAFIRSAFYPSVHVNRNINASQKSSFTEPVFWDTNEASCNY